MGTTDNNGIYFYEETDSVSPLHTLLNVAQQSVSDALDDTARIFPAANAAARAALLVSRGSSSTNPLLVRQVDTGEYWEHNGTAWRVIAGSVLVSGSGALAANTTETVVPGCTLSLVAGTWDLYAKGFADWAVTGAGPRYIMRLRSTSTSGTIHDESQIYIGGELVGSVPFSLQKAGLVLASTTNILLTAVVTGPSGGSTPLQAGVFNAVRRA
jgi:hypothetical protein